VRAIGCGMRVSNPEARDAYGMLASDLSHMVEACAQALVTRQPQALVEAWHTMEGERPGILSQLARLAANRRTGDGAMPGAEAAAFDALTHRLVALLAGREAA